MPAIKIFSGEDTEVPEGSSHYYECTLEDRGVAIQLAAITAIVASLDDLATGTPINSKTTQNVLNANQGTLVDAGGGVGQFTWALNRGDALVVDASKPSEQHRITLEFTYTRAGLPPGTLTHEVIYRVRNLARIS
jgi:hypothetical protein